MKKLVKQKCNLVSCVIFTLLHILDSVFSVSVYTVDNKVQERSLISRTATAAAAAISASSPVASRPFARR